jgi:hypothetical protein
MNSKFTGLGIAMATNPILQWFAKHFRLVELLGMAIAFGAAGLELSALRGLDSLKQDYQARLAGQFQHMDQLKTRTLMSADVCAMTQPLQIAALHRIRYDTQMFRYRSEVGSSLALGQLTSEIDALRLQPQFSCDRPLMFTVDRLSEELRMEVRLAHGVVERNRTANSRVYKSFLLVGTVLLVIGKLLNWVQDFTKSGRRVEG